MLNTPTCHHLPSIPSKNKAASETRTTFMMRRFLNIILEKKSMVVDADDNANLGELTRRTERLEDVIGAVQTTVNQLNQFLV